MKKVLTLTAALLTLCTSLSLAGGVNLSGNAGAVLADCWGMAPINAVTFACNSNSGSALNAIGSAIPTVDVPKFIGVTVVIDIQVAGATLPSWWLTQTGGCRAGPISMDFNPANLGTCLAIWPVAPTGVVNVANGVGGPNRIRVIGGAALQPQDGYLLVGDGLSEYAVCKLNIARSKTIGAAPCAGCTTGACVVLNEIKLVQPSGAPGGDSRLTAPAGNDFVTYNAGAPVCPGATPTHNRTWGAVKSLYR